MDKGALIEYWEEMIMEQYPDATEKEIEVMFDKGFHDWVCSLEVEY